MTTVRDGWEILLERLRSSGWSADHLAAPATSLELDRAAAQFGRALHPSVIALYEQANGMVEAPGGTEPVEVFAGVTFRSLQEAVHSTLGLRRAAAQPGMPEGLWSDSWFTVFELWADHVVAVDCEDGSAWFVWWEDTRIHRVATDLGSFLEQWAELVSKTKARFDEREREWVLPPRYSGDTVPSRPMKGPGRADIAGLPHPSAFPPAPPSPLALPEAWKRLLDLHGDLGSPVPNHLRPGVSAEEVNRVEATLGCALDPQVRELFRAADGIDGSAFTRSPQILPTLSFGGLAAALEDRTAFEDSARGFVQRERWWGSTWLPVFRLRALTAIAVDNAGGRVWSVGWAPGETGHPRNPLTVRPVAPDLASYLAQATRILARAPVVFDRASGRFKHPKGTGPSFV